MPHLQMIVHFTKQLALQLFSLKSVSYYACVILVVQYL